MNQLKCGIVSEWVTIVGRVDAAGDVFEMVERTNINGDGDKSGDSDEDNSEEERTYVPATPANMINSWEEVSVPERSF
jgi:hypothetical protein